MPKYRQNHLGQVKTHGHNITTSYPLPYWPFYLFGVISSETDGDTS